MFKKSIHMAAVAAAATLFLTLSLGADEKKPAAKLGAEAPGFTLDDQNGKSVSLSDYKGKIVVLEWVNKDCPIYSRVAKSKTTALLADKWKDKDVVVLGIDSTAAHTADDRKKTVEQFSLPYPVLNDASGVVGHTYDARTTPHMFIIDKKGALVYMGAIDNDPQGNKTDRVNYVDKALTELVAGQSVSTAETKPYGCSVKYK